MSTHINGDGTSVHESITSPSTNGRPDRTDELTAADEALLDIVANAFTSRMDWLKAQADPRRNIEKECGFPDDGAITDKLIDHLVTRDALAAAVVERMPRACWQVSPLVYETDAADEVTDFERAWDDLGKNLRTEKSFHKQELGSVIWEYLCRADIMSRRGRYGIVLFGFDDNPDLSQPVEGMEEWFSQPSSIEGATERDGYRQLSKKDTTPKANSPGWSGGVFNYQQARAAGIDADLTTNQEGFWDLTVNKAKTKGRKLLYLRVFPEALATAISWETNDTSPRFGHPTTYQLTFNDPKSTGGGAIGGPINTVRNVHWTRCLHVADVHHTTPTSEVLAVPAVEPVLDIILSAKKVWAGGAEGFWQGCFPTTYFETNPQVAGNVKIDRQSLREMAFKIQNGTQRHGVLDNVSAKTVAPTVVDFTPFMDSLINLICIKLEMPVRIFMGSERGELASTQDDAAWNDRVKQRQNGYVTPRIIVPFVDRLVNAGVLPEPVAKSKPTSMDTADKKDAYPVLPGAKAASRASGTGVASPTPPSKPIPVANVGFLPPKSGTATRTTSTALSQPADEPPTQPGVPSKVGPPVPSEVVGSKAKALTDEATGYCVEWPDITSMSQEEKATVSGAIAVALDTYTKGGASTLVPPMEFLTKVMDWTEEEAVACLESAVEHQDATAQKEAQKQKDAIAQGLAPDPTKPPVLDPIKLKEGETLVPHPASERPSMPTANKWEEYSIHPPTFDITDNEAKVIIKELSKYLYGLVSDVTIDEARNIARAVKVGIADDLTDEQVAAKLRKVLPEEDYNAYRTHLIATTEMSRARAELLVGNMDPADTVRFTAHKDCCDHCQTLNGKEYTAKSASGVIPVHPACKCHWDKGADPLTGNTEGNTYE